MGNRDEQGGEPRVNLYTLLYRDPGQIRHSNLKQRGSEAFDIYILCAAAAAQWARRQGNSLRIVTNDAAFVRERLGHYGHAETPVLEMAFSLEVPQNIPFRSAHFKVELIQRLGDGDFGEVIGVVDSDAFFAKPIKAAIIAGTDFVAYDISPNIECEFGRKGLIHDIELLAGRPISNPRWYGGEFLVAKSSGFNRLGTYLRQVWPNYVREIEHTHHVHDEPVVSAALNLAAEDGYVIADAGVQRLVTRWWSSRILYPQKGFDEISDHAILHFPADKGLIARAALNPGLSANFTARYRSYARWKVMIRAGVNLLDKVRGRPGKFAPRM